MSASSVGLHSDPEISGKLLSQHVRRSTPERLAGLSIAFWTTGILLAFAQAWVWRYQVSSDSIAYLDMSDYAFPGTDWHRIIHPIWSPLYPFLLGLFRRALNISPANEIVAGHLLNVGFFIFAFACFEFFLRTVLQKMFAAQERAGTLLPRWAYACLGYGLFLWASIFGISLQYLRADMLMSGFVYLACAILLLMHGSPARWKAYVLLGSVLGIGFLSKGIFLPLGVVALALSLFVVADWRPALKMAASSLGILLAIASLYFVPLSAEKGRFSLGEVGAFNYVIHVNHAGPSWYLQYPGTAKGSLVHPPQKIFDTPLTYAFPWQTRVTNALRFDPSYWMTGVRPRFVAKPQMAALMIGIRNFADLSAPLLPVALIAIALGIVAWHERRSLQLKTIWPLLVIGLVGCLLYLPIHVEARYVTEFIAIFWFSVIASLGGSTLIKRGALVACAAALVVALVFPLALSTLRKRDALRATNQDAEAAAALAGFGVGPGSEVARVSDNDTDMGIERLARVKIVAEIDRRQVAGFLSSAPSSQDPLLNLLSSRGIKAVIATVDDPDSSDLVGWRRLGATRYWAWLPQGTTRQDLAQRNPRNLPQQN